MRHDRRIVFIAIVATFIQLVVFGCVLSADVKNLPLGVVDDSRTPQSQSIVMRQLLGALARRRDQYRQGGRGVVIPYDYAHSIVLRKPTQM